MTIDIDSAFNIPEEATGELFYDGRVRAGRLRELLDLYQSLSQASRDRACIRLDHRVILPGEAGSAPRESALTLYDGEIATLLPHLER